MSHRFVDVDTHLEVDHHIALSRVDGAFQNPDALNTVGWDIVVFVKVADELAVAGRRARMHSKLKFLNHDVLIFMAQN